MKRLIALCALILATSPVSCDRALTEPDTTSLESTISEKGGQNKIEPLKDPLPQMVFFSDRDGDTDIFLLDLDASGDLRNLTDNRGTADSHPAWSPTGDQVVFSSNRPRTDNQLWALDLWVMSVDDTGNPGVPFRLPSKSGPDLYAAWSPDGQKIAWACRENPGRYNICLIERDDISGAWPTDPSDIVTLTNAQWPCWYTTPSWSPESDELVFVKACLWEERDLWTVDITTGALTPLTQTPEVDESDPAWSVNDEIAYIIQVGDNELEEINIFLSPIKNFSRAEQLTFDGDSNAPFWVPGGKQIAFTRGEPPDTDIFLMDADGGNQTNLTEGTTFNGYGQFRQGSGSNPPLSVRPEFEAISAGDYHTCALTPLGDAYCWGWDLWGQLGTATSPGPEVTIPTLVSGGHKFLSISAGAKHTCGLTTGNDVYCWGHSFYGEVGDGFTGVNAQPVPQLAANGQAFKTLSVGTRHSCGITSGDETWCWGWNERRQLGRETDPYYQGPIPTRIDGDPGFVTVSAGYTHTCGLTADGRAFCWGENGQGQLGLGHFNGYDAGHSWWVEPQEILGYTFQSLQAGGEFTCGITRSEETLCWGRNFYGELGSTPFTGPKPSPSPVDLSALGGQRLTSVTTGLIENVGSHSCGLTSSGKAYCWGWDTWGELGTGVLPPASGVVGLPGPVAGSLTFSSLSAGFDHTCGLTTTGDIYCWGQQQHGRLGNGVITQGGFASPVQVGSWPPAP